MWSRKQRHSAVRILLRRLGVLALFGLVAVSASGAWGVYKKERESASLRAQVEREREDLLNRRAQLDADIARLKTDRGLEEALREQFSLVEEGERLIVIVESPAPPEITATSTFRAWLERAFPWW